MDLLQAPPPILPAKLLEVDVLDAFMVYVTLAFVVSLVLRWRFYMSIYRIATYFAKECPNVFKLLDKHLVMLVQNGIIPMLLAYGAVFGIYFLYTRVFFPGLSLVVAHFAHFPGWFSAVLALGGAMIAIDVVLILDVGKIDEKYCESELRLAEQWLGGRINRMLDLFGIFNPIRVYADYQTRLVMRDFNKMFQYSLGLILVQTLFRAALVGIFFGMLVQRYGAPVPVFLR
jgi:hypothetical protein